MALEGDHVSFQAVCDNTLIFTLLPLEVMPVERDVSSTRAAAGTSFEDISLTDEQRSIVARSPSVRARRLSSEGTDDNTAQCVICKQVFTGERVRGQLSDHLFKAHV